MYNTVKGIPGSLSDSSLETFIHVTVAQKQYEDVVKQDDLEGITKREGVSFFQPDFIGA